MPGSVPTSFTSTKLTILGGGPAGAAAALAGLRSGAAVQVVEKSGFPRHKVCGEFLSPGILPALESLGLLQAFQETRPAAIRRMLLHFGAREKSSVLPEPGFGLSRYAFDNLLLQSAVDSGAELASETLTSPDVIATGRRSLQPRGKRLFGFKAHYNGPAHDSVELFFLGGVYVGINSIENGLTNVCGLGPEDELRRIGFAIDELLEKCAPLRARIAPLSRTMPWLHTGPLEFGNRLDRDETGSFLAGDALSFVDPFTGSGLLSAVLTGKLAGEHAARRLPVSLYLSECRKIIGKPFGVASVLRSLAATRAAEHLIQFVPGKLLFQWTRPQLPS